MDIKNKKITIGEVYELFKKYGDLGLEVNTPYGYKHIEYCDITERDSKVVRVKTENGYTLDCAPKHRVKKPNGKFVNVEDVIIGDNVLTVDGSSKIITKELMPYTKDLYDIQVAEVKQYYSNGILSHNSTFMNALVWLLFGNIDKAKTFDEVINMYNGATFANVSAVLLIEGEEIKIERSVERIFKKKSGEYQKTVSSLKFMKLQPNGEYAEDDKEEDRNATEKKIRENIGTLNEFLMTIVCTGDNIFDIIKAKATERGQTLSRFLGLEIFERKLEAVKTLYNEWKIKSNLGKYTTADLATQIEDNITLIGNYDTLINEKTIDFNKVNNKKSELENEIDNLQSLLYNDIDSSLLNKTEADFKNEIESIERDINSFKIKINELNEKIKTDIDEFNENEFNNNLTKITSEENEIRQIRSLIQGNFQKEINDVERNIRLIENENSRLDGEMSTLRSTIKALKEGDKCPECGQKLENVDHTEVIQSKISEGVAKKAKVDENKVKISELNQDIDAIKAKIELEEAKITTHETNIKELRAKNDVLNSQQLLIKQNDIYKLSKDKIEVDIERLELKKSSVETSLERFIADKEKIVRNNNIKSQIQDKKIEVTVCEEQIRQLQRVIVENTTNKNNLTLKNEELEELITKIKKEEHIAKVFEIYMVMVGKNGISKSIMRKSIPLLNMELGKFLKDSALFTVEIEINEKNNEVEFWKVDNETGTKASIATGSGYEKTIASLAIRIVNSKINTLPKPSLLLIDEIFSTVDNENLELVKMFLDKVTTTIDNVFIITHNELVKEWGNHIINVTKENNISKVSF